jgi:hypothetical protein
MLVAQLLASRAAVTAAPEVLDMSSCEEFDVAAPEMLPNIIITNTSGR